MIHDKDYIIRIVRNFSAMLQKLIVEKNEGGITEHQQLFDTNMSDIFKADFGDFSKLSFDEILKIVSEREPHHEVDYLELLGNLFYVKGRQTGDKTFLENSQRFYELYLQKSGIFSLPIVNRVSELKKI